MQSKERKREDAEARNATWAARSLESKLAYLNQFFPDGAKRQRARIAAQQQKG